jgi:cytohesin
MSRGKKVVLIGIAILCIGSTVLCIVQFGAYNTNRLWHACHEGDAEEVERLLNSWPAVDVNEAPVGISPLQIASQKGHAGVVKVLLAKGVDVDAVDDRRATALHCAAAFGRTEVVEELLANKAKVNVVDEDGSAPLHRAAFGGHLEIVRSLLSHGADADLRDKEGLRPIDAALARGHVGVGKCLLPDSGVPGVFIASGLGMPERLGELLRTTPRLATLKREDGHTPLHVAAVCGQAGAAELLIKRGARVDAKGDWGWTPLHMAGSRNVAQALVANGADVNSGVGGDGTPLYSAALFGRRDVAEYLIEQGADVNARDSDGDSPLHSAAYSGDEGLVLLLIEHGANVIARSHSSDEPFPVDVAKRKGHVRIVEILRKQALKEATGGSSGTD